MSKKACYFKGRADAIEDREIDRAERLAEIHNPIKSLNRLEKCIRREANGRVVLR